MADVPATNENFLSRGQSVEIDVFQPTSTGKYPAVLILHGSFGLLPEYRADIVSFAEALVEKGIAATMPHYLEATKTDPGKEVLGLISKNLPTWKNACADALAFMAKDARFDAAHLGVIGFSLGGRLALSLGMAPPAGAALRCVVDFFGPTQNPPLERNLSKLPPVLILHGTKDPLVHLDESQFLVTELNRVGKTKDLDYFFEWYEGEGHGFTGATLTRSRIKTVDFIKQKL